MYLNKHKSCSFSVLHCCRISDLLDEEESSSVFSFSVFQVLRLTGWRRIEFSIFIFRVAGSQTYWMKKNRVQCLRRSTLVLATTCWTGSWDEPRPVNSRPSTLLTCPCVSLIFLSFVVTWSFRKNMSFSLWYIFVWLGCTCTECKGLAHTCINH